MNIKYTSNTCYRCICDQERRIYSNDDPNLKVYHFMERSLLLCHAFAWKQNWSVDYLESIEDKRILFGTFIEVNMSEYQRSRLS